VKEKITIFKENLQIFWQKDALIVNRAVKQNSKRFKGFIMYIRLHIEKKVIYEQIYTAE